MAKCWQVFSIHVTTNDLHQSVNLQECDGLHRTGQHPYKIK